MAEVAAPADGEQEPLAVSEPAARFIVGSYAAVPKKAPALEASFYAGLAELPLCGGLELGMTPNGSIAAAHSNDEGWLLSQLATLARARKWRIVLTTVTATMTSLERDPHFGLASGDAAGRQRALDLGRLARDAVARINAAVGPGAVSFVEVHSGPTRHGSAAAAAGATSSAAALADSLSELLRLDWEGARLVVEHCDSHEGVAPIKGLLPLREEIEAIRTANAVGATAAGHVLVAVNWARSVLETREPRTAAAHLEEAKAAGLLGGLMFSGCSGVAGPYGQWKDSHMPHGADELVKHFAEGSLLTREEMRRCIRAAGGAAALPYLGVKITAKHLADDDVPGRVALIGDMLALVAAVCAEESGGLRGDPEEPEAKRPRT